MIPRLRVTLAGAALVSAVALLFAIAMERLVGLVPCPLCLLERWPYRVAIVVGVVGLVLPRRWGRWALVLVLLTILVDAGMAVVHVGVEHGFWASPLPACQAPTYTGGTIAERLAQMPEKPSKSCEDAVYLFDWLPISFAEMNLLFTLAFSAVLAMFLWLTRRSER